MLSAAEHPLHDSYTQPHAIEPLFLAPGEHGRAWQAQAWYQRSIYSIKGPSERPVSDMIQAC